MMNENRMISWEEAEQILGGSSYNEPIKSSLPEQTRPTEPDNDTDVDDSIQKLLQNDPKLKEINLNNMKRTPIPQVKRLIAAIRDNTFLEKLSLANMGLYDSNVEPLIDVVEKNSTLKAVNLETNYLSGDFFAKLFQAALKNQTLEEVKAVNQGVTFSTTSEKEIIDAIFANRGIIKVSINLRLPEGRHKIENAMLRNGEIKRVLRRQAAQAAKAADEANQKAEQKTTTKKTDEPAAKTAPAVPPKKATISKTATDKPASAEKSEAAATAKEATASKTTSKKTATKKVEQPMAVYPLKKSQKQ
uniref:Tropomodulin n=2 Tax=Ascaris suum TaxID=6253 RepID=F1LD45_ASCSU